MAQPFLRASSLNPPALGTKPLTQLLGNIPDHNWARLTAMFIVQDPQPWHSFMRNLLIDCYRPGKSKEVEEEPQLLAD